MEWVAGFGFYVTILKQLNISFGGFYSNFVGHGRGHAIKTSTYLFYGTLVWVFFIAAGIIYIYLLLLFFISIKPSESLKMGMGEWMGLTIL